MRKLLALLLVLACAGCAREEAMAVGRYQFLTNNGVILRCDTVTGKLAVFDTKAQAWSIDY